MFKERKKPFSARIHPQLQQWSAVHHFPFYMMVLYIYEALFTKHPWCENPPPRLSNTPRDIKKEPPQFKRCVVSWYITTLPTLSKTCCCSQNLFIVCDIVVVKWRGVYSRPLTKMVNICIWLDLIMKLLNAAHLQFIQGKLRIRQKSLSMSDYFTLTTF